MDPQVFIDIELSQLTERVKTYKSRGWRLANLCASKAENNVELLYSFSAGNELENLRLVIDNKQKMPAISPLYPNAFFFENEARDLYGVVFEGGVLDYSGRFYASSVPTPMNPASLAAQEYLESLSDSRGDASSNTDASSSAPVSDSGEAQHG